ncbi:hypothetical protein Tco_0999769 [Tanacetum coccineum]
MQSGFEMAMMRELKFFLGLRINQYPCGIFINQFKYALDILKKHGMEKSDSIGTPMATSLKLDTDLSGTPFSLVDNSKLSDVDLLLRRLKQNVSLLEGLQGGKKIALNQKE